MLIECPLRGNGKWHRSFKRPIKKGASNKISCLSGWRSLTASRDAVLVASELAMTEIIAGRLPFETALQDRMIALDADPPLRAHLLDAWRGAYREVGFSGFACAQNRRP